MSFKKIVEKLQELPENEGYLVLIRCGVFFVGVGKDAVILTEKLGITNVCFADGICKSGIPVCKIDKILTKLINKDISVAIYEYNPKGIEHKSGEKYELLRRIAMKPVKETRKCFNCEKCIYYDKKRQSSIASTEQILESIDKILEERNEFNKKLTYESLMNAHKLSRRGKDYRKEVILFNLKQEEYIMWLYEKLKSGTYKHSGYTIFYVTEPKLRKIEKSIYLDRIVHRWVVDNFLEPYFVPTFISTSYACLKNKGMHKACIDVQNAMQHLERTWKNYYILKMDVRKYFQNIDKDILYRILARKIQDNKLLWLLKEIIYSNEGRKGLAIGYSN